MLACFGLVCLNGIIVLDPFLDFRCHFCNCSVYVNSKTFSVVSVQCFRNNNNASIQQKSLSPTQQLHVAFRGKKFWNNTAAGQIIIPYDFFIIVLTNIPYCSYIVLMVATYLLCNILMACSCCTLFPWFLIEQYLLKIMLST